MSISQPEHSDRADVILPLSSPSATLALAGGKGANLATLTRAGFAVPPGFIVTTEAYRAFVQANGIEPRLLALAAGAPAASPAGLETASQAIRALFSGATMPPDLLAALRAAYASLSSATQFAPPVAVRSSATAEDLPGLSFAGQQDTFLNVVGAEALAEAVKSCWSSLWTARAMGYRARNGISAEGLALAVVVQAMVEAEASGVMFTANPVTGLRSQTVIDATLGLGEALVSGKVEPDHYVVDSSTGQIVAKTLGAKAISVHGLAGGGTHAVEQERNRVQALPDDQIVALARLGSQIAALYRFPQDIEWAWTDGALHVLQSRPVTALFPLPDGLPPEPLKVMFSFGDVQGMLDPMTPLGRDAVRELFAAGAGLLGVRVTRETQTVLYVAGERLWGSLTAILRNSLGRRVLPYVISFIEPGLRQTMLQVQDDPRLQPGRQEISMHARLQLARFLLPVAANVALNMMAPGKRRQYIVESGERILGEMETRAAAIQGDRWQRLAGQASLLPNLAGKRLPGTLRLFVSAVASGMAAWNLLNVVTGSGHQGQTPRSPGAVAGGAEAATAPSADSPIASDLVLRITRGLPNNPTTEMGLALWDIAKTLRADTASWQILRAARSAELGARYLAGDLPDLTMRLVRQFLNRYGGRGLAEIDLGRARWAEAPAQVFEMLASMARIEDESQAPDAAFARGAAAAQQAIDDLTAAVRVRPHGWLKAHLVRFLAGRARQLMGVRESPKFFLVRLMWIVRRELLKTGRDFAAAGDLEAADDLVYLTLSELQLFAARAPAPAPAPDWRELIRRRRAAYQSELQRRQIPRLLLSDGRAYYGGIAAGAAANTLTGSPVSPGVVQGRVRVVLDPRQANLQPGEILVCPGTDPSWTPLFLSAAGLVMEVGGMMTHGAVVAREYGIPAVVGVERATQRLTTGQLVRVNGSTGAIVILEPAA
jgi:phosphohistidine swiveling domain-containing protein